MKTQYKQLIEVFDRNMLIVGKNPLLGRDGNKLYAQEAMDIIRKEERETINAEEGELKNIRVARFKKLLLQFIRNYGLLNEDYGIMLTEDSQGAEPTVFRLSENEDGIEVLGNRSNRYAAINLLEYLYPVISQATIKITAKELVDNLCSGETEYTPNGYYVEVEDGGFLKVNTFRGERHSEREGEEVFKIGWMKENTPALLLLWDNLFPNKEEKMWVANWIITHIKTGRKTGTALYSLNSAQGVGKGIFVEKFLKTVYGESNVSYIDQEIIMGKFAGEIENTMMLVMNEIEVVGNKERRALTTKLKNYTTETNLSIEKKYQRATGSTPTYFNMYLQSNSHNALDIDPKGRRETIITPRITPLREVVEKAGAWEDIKTYLNQVKAESRKWKQQIRKWKINKEVDATIALQNEDKESYAENSSTYTETFKQLVFTKNIERIAEITWDRYEDYIDSAVGSDVTFWDNIYHSKTIEDLTTKERVKVALTRIANEFDGNIISQQSLAWLYKLIVKWEDPEYSIHNIHMRAGRRLNQIFTGEKPKKIMVRGKLIKVRKIDKNEPIVRENLITDWDKYIESKRSGKSTIKADNLQTLLT